LSAAAPEAAVVSAVVLGRPAAALAVAGRAVGADAVADAALGAAVGAAAAGLSYLSCSRRNCLSSGGKRGSFPS